ncbi:rod shape-determining protein MreC [Granulicella sp. dw_53]|uniref:rod shape-determining protein MreC n=1 Tax=Granulicella sp. dw_53 TaxID=2719792 RepID=UPI001BD37E88|nr:rod shape-determining protein MreC [Granulicella sp. dw_53]
MDSFFARFKNPLILVAVLLAQTIGLAVQVRRPVVSGSETVSSADPHSISLVRYWVVSIVTPFERFFLGIGHNVRFGWSNYIDLRNTRQQNAALQHQLADMRIQQAAIAQDAIQGHRLQALLAFQQHYVARTVAAQVIGTSGTEFSRVIYIDKGREDGLKPDQAVITPDGIVGKLRDVFPHTAQVLLIDDQTSGAGVILSSTHIRAILRGTSTGRIVINNLTADSRIKPGEIVLTSGGDQVYPRGLAVGTIESVAPDPDHQPYTTIRVHPAANLSQLEEVLIITATQTELPPQAKQDLAVGAATAEAQALAAAAHAAELKAAEEAKSATQIVADRLPSLHDANNPDAPTDPKATVVTADPVGKVPRPLPTLHPDRYSPGSTPSAADLTPGSASPATTPSSTPPPPEQSEPAPSARKPRTTTPPQTDQNQ